MKTPATTTTSRRRLPELLAIGCLWIIAAAEPPSTSPDPEQHLQVWPSISIALQDQFSALDLTDVQVRNDAWCLSGDAFGAIIDARLPREERISDRPESLKKFIDRTTPEIKASLDRYLQLHPGLTRNTTRTIIIDIESPYQPRTFWNLMGGDNHDELTPEFTNLVHAFVRRYAVARAFFPQATLTVFSMGSPDAFGHDTSAARRQLNAEVTAARMGLLEHVDAISPELYERYGPGDPHFKSMKRITNQSLSHAVKIVQASGQSRDIIVMMSLLVYNAPGHSVLAMKPADLTGIADRLTYLASLGIKRVIFWNGSDTLEDTEISIRTRLRQLRALQPPPPEEPAPPRKSQESQGPEP